MERCMDKSDIEGKLVAVLEHIQAASGEDCPPLDGTVKPAEELPKFNSKVWAVAAGMLSVAIGAPIPPEANIFVNEATKEPLTIKQTVELVSEIVAKHRKCEAAAA
jgi:hypothetical protein